MFSNSCEASTILDALWSKFKAQPELDLGTCTAQFLERKAQSCKKRKTCFYRYLRYRQFRDWYDSDVQKLHFGGKWEYLEYNIKNYIHFLTIRNKTELF